MYLTCIEQRLSHNSRSKNMSEFMLNEQTIPDPTSRLPNLNTTHENKCYHFTLISVYHIPASMIYIYFLYIFKKNTSLQILGRLFPSFIKKKKKRKSFYLLMVQQLVNRRPGIKNLPLSKENIFPKVTLTLQR